MNWYAVLGVEEGASHEDIRAAHRSLVRTLHPDSRDPGLPPAEADAALRLVNDAWSVLGDPARRADYDIDLESGDRTVDEEPWTHGRRGFPWWIVALAVLLVIFVFTAYAGAPAGPTNP